MAHIKKGDTVTVLSGKDRGKSGKVLQVWPTEGRALVEQLNVVKHFDRKSQQNPSGGVIAREHPVAIAKLALVCSKCRKPSRVGWVLSSTAGKQRVCRRCGGPL